MKIYFYSWIEASQKFKMFPTLKKAYFNIFQIYFAYTVHYFKIVNIIYFRKSIYWHSECSRFLKMTIHTKEALSLLLK